jgi:hypothetical protein
MAQSRENHLESISYMPREHVQACEVYEAEKVVDVEFPSGEKSARVLHPGEESLDFSSATIAFYYYGAPSLSLAV